MVLRVKFFDSYKSHPEGGFYNVKALSLTLFQCFNYKRPNQSKQRCDH